jgi:dephospho-CoA kinase
MGCAVIDGDMLAREVVQAGSPVLTALADTFGSDIVGSDGALRRSLLAERAFADAAGRRTLGEITHPAITALAVRRAALVSPQSRAIVVDAAALQESELAAMCDWLVVVTAPEELRLRRLLARDGVDASAVSLRMRAQRGIPYVAVSDPAEGITVIENTGAVEELLAPLGAVLRQLDKVREEKCAVEDAGKRVIAPILNRYTCRDFNPEQALSEDQLHLLTLAGLAAPSAMNRQPWRMVFVTNRAQLAEMDVYGMQMLAAQADRGTYERLQARGGTVFYHAPCAVFLAVEGNAAVDCGILAQSIVLTAATLGIDSCICGLAGQCFAGERGTEFFARLGVPEGFSFGLAVLLGHAKQPGTPHPLDYGKASRIA